MNNDSFYHATVHTEVFSTVVVAPNLEPVVDTSVKEVTYLYNSRDINEIADFSYL